MSEFLSACNTSPPTVGIRFNGVTRISFKFNAPTLFSYFVRRTRTPEFGKVSCVSMGFIRKGEYNYESFYGDNEIDILTQVRDIFNKVETMGYDLCGQNIKFFDIPFLGKRYFINGLIPPTLFPRHNTKPWELRVLDTKDIWQFGNNWSLSSLDLQCLSLGLDSPKNGDVKGDNVTENHWNGEYKKISEYCEKDVKSLMDIITKLNELE